MRHILLAVNTEGKTLQFCKTTIQVTLKQNKGINFLLKTQEKRVSPLPRQYKWLRQRTVNQNSEVTELECFYSPRIELSWTRTAQLQQVNEHAGNFGFPYSFKQQRKMIKQFETQCM